VKVKEKAKVADKDRVKENSNTHFNSILKTNSPVILSWRVRLQLNSQMKICIKESY